jgi:hypothetical protein
MTQAPDDFSIANETLITQRRWHQSPHVVILGAGASRAAFPDGDANGIRLPVMADLVTLLDLTSLLVEAGYDPARNFETLYSTIHASYPNSPVLRQMEERVERYFDNMSLPATMTIYDQLLLSLKEKDAIFTFNWDPFLVDAYLRHRSYAKLPQIFHLHGNVRVFCGKCKNSTVRLAQCPVCGSDMIASKLLYPIEQKNYADDPFIKTQWDAARQFIRDAFIITIFGYSAPKTDQEAMAIIREAWRGADQDRLVDRVEIIDTRDRNELAEQWSPFSYHQHYDLHREFSESLLFRYPRRTCEALYHIGVEGKIVKTFSLPMGQEELTNVVLGLQKYEL